MSTREKEKKFEYIYKENIYKVRFFVRRYIPDNDVVEEVAHEVFIKLWEVMDSLDLEKSILPYLLTLAKNKTLNILKHNKIVEEYICSEKKRIIESQALDHCNISNLYSKEVQLIINDTLSVMPVKIRETFLLSRVDNKTYLQIATALGVSQKTVEYRMKMAFRLLRKNLQEYLHILLFII
jgi:RNA polymerase sigma-70 factor, ECF subfamily